MDFGDQNKTVYGCESAGGKALRKLYDDGELTALTTCSGFKHEKVDGEYTDEWCGYYKATTADGPADIREWMSKAAGLDSYVGFMIANITQPFLDGVPLTDAQQTTRDDERKAAAEAAAAAAADSAERVFGSIMAVGAALALLQ